MNSFATQNARTKDALVLGDFTGLADNYSRFRPAYSQTVLRLITALSSRPIEDLCVADLGAGTGIWTRMLASRDPAEIFAVEPNADMRAHGMRDSVQTAIQWREGSGEKTGLPAARFDLVTAASCFHWFDYASGMAEVNRILKPAGWFVALWNPRHLRDQPILVEIEEMVSKLSPNVVRKSSGSSKFVADLTERFSQTPGFKDVTYIEGRHEQTFSPEAYLGVWSSVNDIRAQMGEKSFRELLSFIERRISGLSEIKTQYLTRAWAVQKAL